MLRHDTSRALQLAIKYGTQEQRAEIVSELKGHFLNLIKNKTGHFTVLKLVDYCPPATSDLILGELRGKIRKLSLHVDGAQVLDFLFAKGTPTQQIGILREFFGHEVVLTSPTFEAARQQAEKLVKEKGRWAMPVPSSELQRLLEVSPEKRLVVLDNIEGYLLRCVEKEQLMFRFVHSLLYQFLTVTSPEAPQIRELMASALRYPKALYHSREGALALAHCLSYSSAKDRKACVKALKGAMLEMALSEHGYLALLRLLDVVDDTVLIRKQVIAELLAPASFGVSSGLRQLTMSQPGSRVLQFLLGAEVSPSNFSKLEMQVLAPAFLPAYLMNRKEKDDDDDADAPSSKKKVTSADITADGAQYLTEEEKAAVAEDIERANWESQRSKRLENRASEEAKLATLTAEDRAPVRTSRKAHGDKIRELVPTILASVLEALLEAAAVSTAPKLSNVVLPGQQRQMDKAREKMNKRKGSMTNDEEEHKDEEHEEDQEGEEGEEENKGEEDNAVEDNAPKDPLASLIEVCNSRPSQTVIFFALVKAFALQAAAEEAETKDANDAANANAGANNNKNNKNKKNQNSSATAAIKTASDAVIAGLFELCSRDNGADNLAVSYHGHTLLKRLALRIEPESARMTFNLSLWETLKPRLSEILKEGRGCFVLTAILTSGGEAAKGLKAALKPLVPKLKKAENPFAGLTSLLDTYDGKINPRLQQQQQSEDAEAEPAVSSAKGKKAAAGAKEKEKEKEMKDADEASAPSVKGGKKGKAAPAPAPAPAAAPAAVEAVVSKRPTRSSAAKKPVVEEEPEEEEAPKEAATTTRSTRRTAKKEEAPAPAAAEEKPRRSTRSGK